MSRFGNRRIDEITGEEIEEIVNTPTPEDLWLEFKSDPWKQGNDGDFELLHDMTAMANAEGGYLFLGITTGKSQGRDVAMGMKHVSKVSGVVQRIRSSCQELVDPPIREIDVQPKSVRRPGGDCVDIVGVRVPVSHRRPHAFRWRDATVFVKRYGTDVRSMPISELGPELARSYFPQTETNRRLDELASEVRTLQREIPDLKTAVSPTSGALAVTDVDDQLIEYMDERFKQITGRRSDTQETED